MCVSALVEANGLYLEPVLQAIAEQLPALWERARDSVPIHSCLLSGECTLVQCRLPNLHVSSLTTTHTSPNLFFASHFVSGHTMIVLNHLIMKLGFSTVSIVNECGPPTVQRTTEHALI